LSSGYHSGADGIQVFRDMALYLWLNIYRRFGASTDPEGEGTTPSSSRSVDARNDTVSHHKVHHFMF
jgi:hypothetical protein